MSTINLYLIVLHCLIFIYLFLLLNLKQTNPFDSGKTVTIKLQTFNYKTV